MDSFPGVELLGKTFENAGAFAGQKKCGISASRDGMTLGGEQAKHIAVRWPVKIMSPQADHLEAGGERDSFDFTRGVFAIVAVGGFPAEFELSVPVRACSAQSFFDCMSAGEIGGGKKKRAASFQDAIDFSQETHGGAVQVFEDFATEHDVKRRVGIGPGK